ncbi:MAG: helix-turn-helix domain-containing protein [Propionibacteriaceae bacterium]|jgi:transcriptional regulator with XRE-family HTH domain|nr:helix-turn-helix domain-containing protein [Propionibacteriaceae bacterium]
MVSRKPARAVLASARDVGAQLATWRKLSNLTSQQVAERAGVSRSTVSHLENGEVGVSMGAFLSVCAALGILNQVVTATDPYETDLGRARADQALPRRVRR